MQRERKSKTKPSPWHWGDQEERAKSIIIEKLTSPPILAYADFTLPFTVHTDASGDGLGAVLYQHQNGVDRVIAYASRGLRGSEKLYPTHKREFLALKWAITDKFHDYLCGNRFEVKTDNNPLTYVMNKAKLDATSHRWVASLADYDFSITYRSGKTNIDADVLSRLVSEKKTVTSEIVKAVCTSVVVTENPTVESVLLAQNVDTVTSNDEENPIELCDINWADEQLADQNISNGIQILKTGHKPSKRVIAQKPREVRKLLNEWEKLYFKNGILYRTGSLQSEKVQQLVLPDAYRGVALTGLHDDVGHQGRDRTLFLVKSRCVMEKTPQKEP